MNTSIFRIRYLMFLILGAVGLPSYSWAATINTTNCSQSVVQAAINSSSNGDTVTVPAGICSWSSNVNIGYKAITLQGAGVGQTNITNTLNSNQNSILNFNQHATISTRITGFSFLGMGYNHRAINCQGSLTSAPMRIDHNSFYTKTGDGNGGTVEVDIFSCRGLLDHNAFTAPSNAEMIHNRAGGTSDWNKTVVPGSSNALYIEDNTFSSIVNSSANSALQNYDGSVVVARYNTLYSTQIDIHGCCSPIGGRWSEIYNNNFINNLPGIDKNISFRAGSGVVFNNTASGPVVDSGINFQCDASPGFVGLGYGYAKWSPVYVWGNGTIPVTYTKYERTVYDCKEGTNWITFPTQPSSMKIWQKSTDNANTTYSYTPFTYPYPLDANGMPNPSSTPPSTAIQAPTSLQIIQ
jgi:hypothetical protein